ncbi:MAG: PASTA domain-containing protein [Eubacterium sp.]|nr:PASTA domain-containing protein [Eubacterium sp.]
MTETSKLCMGCMGEKTEEVCEHCGYSENTPYLPSYLAPGTVLNDRYIAGRLLSYNGEGATYIGYDKVTSTKVTIKEYMPDALCSRKKDAGSITVEPNKLPLYKTFMSEFVELNKALMKARSMTHIQTVLDIFPQNNTAYVVCEYINGIPLKTYLSNCSGELSWDKVKELFPPILTTLGLVHSAGIIHRGISPNTILVTDKNELKLIDFQISAGRTANTEIACELAPGYSAPELYSSDEWHGTWTDVYGICATLYRVLTGLTPTESIARLDDDSCPEPMAVNRNVPSHVSKVIMNGLKLSTSSRIQTITELVVKLFEQPRFNTAQTEAIKPAARPQPANRRVVAAQASAAAAKKKNQNNKIMVIIAIAVCAVIIIGFSVAIALLAANGPDNSSSGDPNFYSAPESTASVASSSEVSSSQTTTAESSYVPDVIYMVPNFEGNLISNINENERYSYLNMTVKYEFNNDVANGFVIEQSIEAGTEVEEGEEITITVSKGPRTVPLPDYTGKTSEQYVATLSQKNIKFETKEMVTDEVPEGYVVKCSKDIGASVDVEHSESVTVYYAKAPEVTSSEADSSAAGSSSADSQASSAAE